MVNCISAMIQKASIRAFLRKKNRQYYNTFLLAFISFLAVTLHSSFAESSCSIVFPCPKSAIISSNYIPVLPTSTTIKSITIQHGASLDGGSGTLTLLGNWINYGNFQPSSSTIIFDSISTIYGLSTFSNLTINSDKSLNLDYFSMVTINSIFNNNGLITILSNEESSASLIHNSNGVSGMVKKHITGWNTYPTNEQYDHGWHTICSPVAECPIDNFHTVGSGNDFFSWDESAYTWINRTIPGPALNPSFETDFISGKGYLIANESSAVATFSGAIHCSDIPFSDLSYSSNDYAGWHLIGNPFPSSLSWNDGNWNLSNIDANAQIWNESTASYSVINPEDLIPAMNGFMIHASSGTNTLTIPKASRIHSSTNLLKTSSSFNRIKLIAYDLDGNTSQETIIDENPNATNGFDADFDSHFLAGFAPMFYSTQGNSYSALQTIPSFEEDLSIPLGFIKNNGSSFEIQLSVNTTDFDIYLKDLKTNITTLLNEGSYSFTSDNQDDANRFLLTFKTLESQEVIQESADIYTYEGSIYGTSNTRNSYVKVYDMLGKILGTYSIPEIGKFEIPVNLTNGVYIISLQSNNQLISKQIIVQE